MKIRFFSFHFLLFMVAVLTLASCHSSKKAAKEKAARTQATTTIVTQTPEGTSSATASSSGTATVTPSTKKDKQEVDISKMNIPVGTNFTSKVRVTLKQEGKDITTTGTLRMRYDDVIQITLVDPVLGIAEVGRLELSPDKMLLIDRINKRYVETPYSEFDAFKKNNIDFATIQDFFWKEAQNSDAVSYSIPAKSPIQLDLKLSGKGNSSNWSAHTTVSDKYTKTDANRLFSSMMNK
ncbi:MAG: DUF4292 domain-containing protein [Bacteroidaceae bacterium]|nr:DUF4292 domain-containing protein [Bacteroidaceae bacterium]